ncbi:MAG: hypothetical protein Q8M02_03495 [Candidatus Didemnitutus sp.]|nr:hypothetical protein [Candidatus Didemnitutus sp.]
MKTSGLYYWNTDIEVMLGDVVQVKRWFSTEQGIVAYIPDLSPKRKDVEDEALGSDWMIRRSKGGFWSMGYAVETPPGKYRKNIRFIRRGFEGVLTAQEDLGAP